MRFTPLKLSICGAAGRHHIEAKVETMLIHVRMVPGPWQEMVLNARLELYPVSSYLDES